MTILLQHIVTIMVVTILSALLSVLGPGAEARAQSIPSPASLETAPPGTRSSRGWRRATYPTIHRYRAPQGPTTDLSYIDNSTCPPVHGIDSSIKAFLTHYSIAGATLGVMRNDSLLYVKSYGYSDRDKKIPMEPSNIMRVASVSKLLTSIGIMKLQEEGHLSISECPLAPGGILGDEPYCKAITDQRFYDVTIEHLLRHEGGFSSKDYDPMFTDSGVSALERNALVAHCLGMPMGFDPGTSNDYSNIGYYLLGLIIEKISGEKYADWMQKNIFAPMNCHKFRMAGSYLCDRLPGEVKYYDYPRAPLDIDYHANGRRVPRCYGGNNVAGLEGAGSWAASVPELCRITAGIDIDPGVEDILGEKSIRQMTTCAADTSYALGWISADRVGIWTRTGSFAGTNAIIRNYSWDGDCWVLVTNSCTPLGSRLARKTSSLFMEMRRKYLWDLPKKDLFHR